MPALTSGKVLVTGANGYIAVWVVKTLLEKGFSVRGTVRSENKIPYLANLFKSFGDKVEFVVVSDITKDGAFDEAVQGVDAIAHTASPFHYNAVDPDEIIGPAVKGTTGVLVSALKHAPKSVKRVVVTSSCASILQYNMPPTLYSEKDWNVTSVDACREQGAKATDGEKYSASKALAERAAWEYYNAHKSEVGWDLVALNPPYVYGPFLHEVKNADQLNESMHDFYEAITGKKDNETLANDGASYIDVRDLAEGHVRALTTPEASGERIIVCAGPWKYQDFVDIAHKLYPELPAGNTSYDPTKAVHYFTYDPAKQQRIFGIKPRSMQETVADALTELKERKWL